MSSMSMKKTRMEELAAEAAQASLDAHEKELVSPEVAYDFLRTVYLDIDDDREANELLGRENAPIDFVVAYFGERA
jgi:hypothetical protein